MKFKACVAVAAGAWLLACLWGFNWMWHQTYHPGSGINPMSAVPATASDLAQVSTCARELFEVQRRLGVGKALRGELFYIQWKCDAANPVRQP